jgi:hypothetical protein
MEPNTPVSGSQALARIFWMMVGPVILMVLIFSIADRGGGWITALDIAFLVALGCMILARLWEFRGGNPQTATGEPATQADLRKFVALTVAFGLGAWIVANLVGNHWLDR